MKKNVFYLIGILLLMVSCYPGEIESYEELDLVYTNYSEDFDFAGKNTYAMPDKIVKITGNLDDGEEPEYVDPAYATVIFNNIDQNMSALGWTKINDAENADVVIIPAAWTNTTVVYWYDYWCWYYYYYCGWGWYYPYATSYTTGTLVMGMVVAGDEYVEPNTVWSSAINGLLTGSFSANRVSKAIDQAFNQSPYLDTK